MADVNHSFAAKVQANDGNVPAIARVLSNDVEQRFAHDHSDGLGGPALDEVTNYLSSLNTAERFAVLQAMRPQLKNLNMSVDVEAGTPFDINFNHNGEYISDSIAGTSTDSEVHVVPTKAGPLYVNGNAKSSPENVVSANGLIDVRKERDGSWLLNGRIHCNNVRLETASGAYTGGITFQIGNRHVAWEQGSDGSVHEYTISQGNRVETGHVAANGDINLPQDSKSLSHGPTDFDNYRSAPDSTSQKALYMADLMREAWKNTLGGMWGTPIAPGTGRYTLQDLVKARQHCDPIYDTGLDFTIKHFQDFAKLEHSPDGTISQLSIDLLAGAFMNSADRLDFIAGETERSLWNRWSDPKYNWFAVEWHHLNAPSDNTAFKQQLAAAKGVMSHWSDLAADK